MWFIYWMAHNEQTLYIFRRCFWRRDRLSPQKLLCGRLRDFGFCPPRTIEPLHKSRTIKTLWEMKSTQNGHPQSAPLDDLDKQCRGLQTWERLHSSSWQQRDKFERVFANRPARPNAFSAAEHRPDVGSFTVAPFWVTTQSSACF